MKDFKSGFFKGLGFLLSISIVAILVLAVYSHYPCFHYRNAFLPKDDIKISLNELQTKTLNQLISKGIVISASDLYNDTLAYYNTLITWLIGILGLSGFFGYLYLRGTGKEDAEKEAEKAVENYCAKQSAHTLLESKIAAEVDSQVEPIKESLEQLKEELELLKNSTPEVRIPPTAPEEPR